MPSKFTWQARGEYLAGCHGRTPREFAAEIDSVMAARQNIAAKATSNPRAGANAGGKAAKNRKTTAGARTKEPAAAGT